MHYRHCLFPLLLLPGFVTAQENPWAATFAFDNDFFARTDSNYSSGVRASLASPDVGEWRALEDNGPALLGTLNRWLRPLQPDIPGAEPVLRSMAFSTGQMIYTPADRSRATPDPNDRPYAGWLYGSLAYHARTGSRLRTVEISAGMVGPASQAEEAQKLFHDLHDIEHFQGWEHQLKNEPGLQLALEHKQRLNTWHLPALRDLELDIITHWGAGLGNVSTYVNAGAQIRLGKRLPRDFGMSSIWPGRKNFTPGLTGADGSMGLHVFIAANGRAVARNLFLDGNTFRDSHRVNSKPLVGEFAIGLELMHGRWRSTFTHFLRSREFAGQADPQQYGSISVTYRYGNR